MKDGWHTIQGYNVYIENDRVLGGVKGYGTLKASPTHPYKTIRGMIGWHNCTGVKVSTFSKGVARGNYRMM